MRVREVPRPVWPLLSVRLREAQAKAPGGCVMTWQPPTPDGPFGYLFHGSACQCEDCTQGDDEEGD